MTCTVKDVCRSASTVTLTVLCEGKARQIRILAADEAAAGGFAVGSVYEMARLQSLSLRYEAVKRALSILSFGDNSAAMLRKKLQEKGVCAENAEFACALMLKKGYIREAEQAARRAERCFFEKQYGPARIRKTLSDALYRRDAIEEAMLTLLQSGVDFPKKAEALYAAFLSGGLSPEKARAKLYRLGYTESDDP